jgi:hypothetical protein
MNRLVSLASFALPVLAGLAAVLWVGAGYAGSTPLALAVTALIGAFFLLGVGELRRYRQATHSLTHALAGLHAPAPALDDWLGQLHPALRPAVRQRVDGARAALPAPALTPYLAGLLVLLGMLGTFAGMVVTLRGTGLALESAGDLAAVRASLAAPVKGLGVAFGTSLAGVATSAMLGLLSALARRERLLASQQLDGAIATTLRAYSPAHQREESFRLLQRQADALPLLAERMHTLMDQLAQQHGTLQDRLLAGQERFHQQAESAYTGLATSVGQSLQDSLEGSARAAGAALQPAVAATLAGLAREASALQGSVSASVQRHLDGLAQRFDTHHADVARHWQQALDGQQQTHAALTAHLRDTLAGFTEGFASRSTALVDQLSTRLADTTDGLAERGQALLAQQTSAADAHAQALQRQLAEAAALFGQQTAQLLQGAQQTLADGQAQATRRDAEQLAAWRAALEQHQHAAQAQATHTQDALAATAAQLAQQAEAIDKNALQRNAELREQLSEQEQNRLAAWQQSLAGVAAQMHQQWQHGSAEGARQQQAILAALAETAQTMAAQSARQAQGTTAEIGRLLDAAAVAPRAAAEVIGELRDKLTDSMARDNAMLDERARMLDTLGALLDRVNHAATEQRQAIDQLVGGSAEVLERTAQRFAERLEADSGRLADAAAQIGAGATEIASLGDAFGQAVQAFGESNAQLGAHLQQLDATLAQSIARSDEQLAYYVAQAREVIDLSLASQQQIVADLQRLAHERAAAGGAAT